MNENAEQTPTTSTVRQPEAAGIRPKDIDRSIYPMPMFVTLPVPDIPAAAEFYQNLGFISLATIPDETGEAMVTHLRRKRYQDILLVGGDPSPGSAFTTFAAHEDDIDAIAAHVRAVFPTVASVEGPQRTPWFTRDLRITDPQGHTVVFSKQIPEDADEAAEWTAGFEGDWEGRPG